MKDYLKEHYVEPTEPTTKMALPNVQWPTYKRKPRVTR
jgi:hypothetical protein